MRIDPSTFRVSPQNGADEEKPSETSTHVTGGVRLIAM
jgi:hypothetical protein